MKMKTCLMLLTVCFAILTLCCGQAMAKTTISMIGTDDAEELMEDLVEAFEEKYDDIRVKLGEGEGTGQGVRLAGTDEVDFGITARDLRANEAQYHLKQIQFGHIPVAFSINSSVGITKLTVAQTRDLFSGKTTNWKEIGGADLPVRLVVRHDGESVQEEVRKSLEGWAELEFSSKSKVAEGEDEAMKIIAKKKGTIGYSVAGELEEYDLDPVILDGMKLGDENYPIHTPLGLVYKEDKLNSDMKKFVDFVYSDDAQKILRKYDVLPASR